MASHFVLDMFWTCDLSSYLYIFDAHGCTFMVLLCDSFIMIWNASAYVMYCYTVCIFLDMIMHDVMVVCSLYAIMNVPV